MTRHLPILTNSELKTWRRCPREWRYSYGLGYRPTRRSPALGLGSMVHAGLEAWGETLRRTGGDRMLAMGHAMGEAVHASHVLAVEPYDAQRAQAMVAGYITRWWDEPMEVLAVEAEFRIPLRNPTTGRLSLTYQLAGKVDAVARVGGKVLLVEHKTSSEDCGPGSDYVKRLRLDGQISLYYAAVRSLGFQPEGVLYDVLRKPAIQPYKATPLEARKYTKPSKAEPVPRLYAGQREHDETPEEFGERCEAAIAAAPEHYYQRFGVERLEQEERDAAADIWNVTQAMREADATGRYPRNVDACVRFGATCVFFGVCTGEESLEHNPRFRIATQKHEELSPDGQQESIAS